MKMTSVIELSSEEVMKAVADHVSANTGFDITPKDMINIYVHHKASKEGDPKWSVFPSVSFQFSDDDV